MEKQWKQWETLLWGGSKITADGDCSHEIKRHFLLGRKAMTTLDSILKSRDITLPTKVHLVKAMVFPIVTHWCESWTVKKAECQRTDVFKLWCWRRLLRVDYKEIQPVHPKGNQSWIFIGRTDSEAETPILWLPDAKNGLIGKDPDAGQDRRLEEKRTTEDGMVGWHHRLDGREFEQAPGVDGKPGVLLSMGSQRVEQDRATELNWLLRISLEGTPGLCPKATLLFLKLFLSCFCIPSLP